MAWELALNVSAIALAVILVANLALKALQLCRSRRIDHDYELLSVEDPTETESEKVAEEATEAEDLHRGHISLLMMPLLFSLGTMLELFWLTQSHPTWQTVTKWIPAISYGIYLATWADWNQDRATTAFTTCISVPPNVLRATTACKFSSLISRDGSAPVALASLLLDPPEPQTLEKTPCFATFLPFLAPASSLL
eukprot:s4877_g3.t1